MTVKEEILCSINELISDLQYIFIDKSRIEQIIPYLSGVNKTHWDSEFVFNDETQRSVNYLALFSSLSFFYWPKPKWHIAHESKTLDGSYALFYALKRAIENGQDITNAKYLKNLPYDTFEVILMGDNHTTIPLLKERYQIAREIGNVLEDKFGGQFSNLFSDGSYDANKINKLLVENFDCFKDKHCFNGKEIKFYKKSQEVLTLISEQFYGDKYGAIQNLSDLAASSDYKLPQILNAWGILQYNNSLDQMIEQHVPINEDSREYLEIRSATIYICELIVEEFKSQNLYISAHELSNLLWIVTQDMPLPAKPYPRIMSKWV